MFNPTTFCMYMYVPVQNQEPVSQWLSSFAFLVNIFVFRLFFVHTLCRYFSRHFIADYSVWALFIVEGRTTTYIVVNFCVKSCCLDGNHTTPFSYSSRPYDNHDITVRLSTSCVLYTEHSINVLLFSISFQTDIYIKSKKLLNL